MKVKFKEKTYESHFQSELGRLTNQSFAPDPTDENILGFDGSFVLPLAVLTGILPYVRPRRWPRLVGMPASAIADFGQELNERLPHYQLNLFTQYKRPHRMTRSSASEWPSWNGAYYRYEITDHQQRLLERVAQAAHGRAAVVYAAAAFSTSADLFRHAEAGTVIANSNIANVERLTGHHRFSYVAAGHHGVAHSDPEPVESEPFEALLRRGAEQESLPFTRHLKSLDELIRAALERDRPSRDLWQLARRALYGGRITDLDPNIRRSWIDALISIVAFNQAFDTRITALSLKSDPATVTRD